MALLSDGAASRTPGSQDRGPFVRRAPVALATLPVQRAPAKQLSSTEILGRLRRIPIIKERLGAKLAQGPTALEHVRRALAAFDKHLALKVAENAFVNEAVRIATIVDATAAELARSIGDPTLKGEIAKELVAAYRGELTEKLSGGKPPPERQGQTDRALTLARALVSADPLMLWMTGKMRLEDAAWKVRDMAAVGRVSPLEMYRSLRYRFEMEMGSYSVGEVRSGRLENDEILSIDSEGKKTPGRAGFDLADLIGEISPSFHWSLVGTPKDKRGKDDLRKLPGWGPSGLVMKKDATDKLAELEKAVLDKNLAPVALSDDELRAERAKSGDKLSPKQSEHFARLRKEEVASAGNYEGMGTTPKQYVADELMKRYDIKQGDKAQSLVDDVLNELATVPLTLTSKLENLFAERTDRENLPKHGSLYKSEPSLMQEEIHLGELIGKPSHNVKAKSIGRPNAEFTESRGKNYIRWRRDKDERETGYHGLGADDLPVFAAVNPNFMTTKGGNANLASWDHDTKKYTGITYGQNYYGDVHMLLKNSVRSRSTMIARGSKSVRGRRIERLDLTFLLADMCRLSMWDYVDALVAAVRKPDTVVLTNMDAEVHIYGGLDLATDVAAIYMQSDAVAATDGPAARCKEFAKKNGIRVEDIGKMPPNYNITARQGQPGGIDLKSAV